MASNFYLKLTLLEKLKNLVKKKFDFDHLKLNNEISAKDYFKNVISKPKNLNTGLKILHFVYFYKNTCYFLNILKRFSKERSLKSEKDQNFKTGNIFNNRGEDFDNIISYDNFDNNQMKIKKQVNDSVIFHNDRLEKDSNHNISSNIKIYEKKDSKDEDEGMILDNDIVFNVDTEKNKDDTDFRKIIMKNQENIDEFKKKINDMEINPTNGKLNNIENAKDMITFVNLIFKY